MTRAVSRLLEVLATVGSFLLDVLWRPRAVRAFLFIAAIFILALTAVLVPDIRVGNFHRGGKGALGLKLGLDLRGGSFLLYEAADPNATEEDMRVAASTIERRVNAFGVAESAIQVMGANRIMVQLPGVTNVEEAKNLIGQTAKLEFKERTCLDTTANCDEPGKYEDIPIPEAGPRGLTGDDLARAWAGQHQTTGAPIINIQFNSRGTPIFADFTQRVAGNDMKRIAILLDGQELLSPVVRSAILGGTGFIEGPIQRPFTQQEVRTISIQLNSGRLRVPLALIQETTVDATLGADSLRKSLLAGLVGLGLVVGFMVAYYRMSGVVAGLALGVYAMVNLAIFKLLPVVLTLPGIAGFILSIGMAVDANILIFERMKEELRAGRSLFSAIEVGFHRAWLAIRDSNVTTFISCAVLYWFGSRMGAALVQGFALTLFIGVAVSMFSAIVVTRNLLELAGLTVLGKRVQLFTPEPLPESVRAARRT